MVPALFAQLVGQVLQLPVVRDIGLSKLHQKTVQALQTAAGSQLAEAPVPPAGSSLVHFLTQAGKFFGKDPTKWEAVGQGKVGSDGCTLPQDGYARPYCEEDQCNVLHVSAADPCCVQQQTLWLRAF